MDAGPKDCFFPRLYMGKLLDQKWSRNSAIRQRVGLLHHGTGYFVALFFLHKLTWLIVMPNNSHIMESFLASGFSNVPILMNKRRGKILNFLSWSQRTTLWHYFLCGLLGQLRGSFQCAAMFKRWVTRFIPIHHITHLWKHIYSKTKIKVKTKGIKSESLH